MASVYFCATPVELRYGWVCFGLARDMIFVKAADSCTLLAYLSAHLCPAAPMYRTTPTGCRPVAGAMAATTPVPCGRGGRGWFLAWPLGHAVDAERTSRRGENDARVTPGSASALASLRVVARPDPQVHRRSGVGAAQGRAQCRAAFNTPLK